MTKQSMTAAELLARLANDAEHQRKLREKETARENLQRQLAADESDLVSEIRANGIEVQSVWDLVNTDVSYRSAIPVLVRHLEVAHHPRTLQGIVRALATAEAKELAFTPLVRLFKQTHDPDSELKWLLGAAIVEASTKDDVDEVIELASDPRHGRGREYLPLGLLNASRDKVLPILEGWTSDPTLAENARKTIQNFRLNIRDR